ncbi:hypothetical protein LOTGIDRAFT_157446 [Lottia gigantea]|uniref:Uncharacterized protein n=1 Tax=Lottia gigantea TaxID=225164 RepID=V4CGP7_LOTGI|nr:hypothetical protein LOTGIDRAFT_157446 [Lottia gigantea]ESP01270.1 hypothetical protein LOTGIDRAFT_157446 [Lottia gigantea]
MDTEKERKGKNRRSTTGDKSRFELVDGAYEKSKKKSLRWADKSVKEVLTYKKNILDIVPSGFPKKKYVKDESAKVSLMEYYEDEIAGEKVIINKQLLYSTDDDKDITIIIRDYITPENFLKNVEYYRQVNKARETYMRAAAVAGDCLQRGEVEGDRDGWLLYLDKCQTDKKKWHKMCEMSHLLREKEVRYEVKKIGIFARIWKRCVEECLDIFPCCFPP